MADPSIVFKPSLTIARKGALKVEGITGNYTVHFGDGQSHEGKPHEGLTHTWPSAGPYTAVAIRDGEHEPVAQTSFRVLAQPTPNVTVEQAPDAEYTSRVTFNDPDEGPVGRFSITWVNGEAPLEVLGIPGTSVEHYYGTTGRHPVLVEDHWSGMRKAYAVEITDPVYDPDATATEDPSDTTRYTVEVTVTNVSGEGRMLTINWDDGATDEISAVDGTTISHQYDFAGDYLISVYYSDDVDGPRRYLPAAIPFGQGTPQPEPGMQHESEPEVPASETPA